MRKAEVYRNSIFAGILIEESGQHFIFIYDDDYFNDSDLPALCLTFPKTKKEYISEDLFPFFSNMLSEGVNRNLQSKQLRIDLEDNFGLLIATAEHDTIGAVTIKPIEINK
jgi:HipA-like protein